MADLHTPLGARQRGLSLIELMIAIALGVVLLLGLVQIFSGVRASFNAADGRARIQENARFALEFLRRDARMAGHLGCQNEFYHFPLTTNRAIEQIDNGFEDRGFVHHLIGPGAASIRDNAPYTTQIHRPIEVYDYAGTSPGDATYVIASDAPAPDGNPASWAPSLPNAAVELDAIAARALPGSDVLVLRFYDEESLLVSSFVPPVSHVITLGAAAADIPRYTLFGMTNCNVARLFQITSDQVATSTTVTAAAGGLNLARQAGLPTFWGVDRFPAGSLMHRYRFVAYYIGNGVNGPALMRQTLVQVPTTAAEGIELGDPEEVIEGVEMMQILLGVDTHIDPRDDFVDTYRSASVQLAAATTPATTDDALRQISTLRISLLLRGNVPQAGAERVRDTIVVGDLDVTLPDDGRARQTYDTTITIRNRVRS